MTRVLNSSSVRLKCAVSSRHSRRAETTLPARAGLRICCAGLHVTMTRAPTQAWRGLRLQTVESLNSLSVDIARAIDHETFIDLWNRYRNGERNVFTRRLYTLQGQQTFDEIRQKYARDPEFRTAVERYVSDFEQLLAQVSRNDRDNMLGQTYLTSDTGKVYTMLAHASGRLD